ncbi:N-methylhydantoinase B [Rhodovastum atsumiense]|uniref:Hydantoinase B/oxoprolinase family protein n=1 Tax=Rhodovastum atsumiense TaxID=504468 RepID=A0A5M6IWQ0_9PROT|nr:hydantoinase B/oxoprolinase family protein [Rhodovastum atsumiense]KAA5612750.1 hydantoinase B/oxoprolinase family protein [Rhodovastum atsumiense]CAH2602688.1 N-methylhydantoinase B [Rhodovastum atsumiense]
MPKTDGLAAIRYQVMWNRLIAVVEEQAKTLVRTAFGASTREAGDLSAGVYDTAGRMLAQAVTGTPGHVNSMARSVTYVLDKVSLAEMADGDVFILNDPWQGTGHLNDIVVVTPVFRRGAPVGLFACTLHVVDIGGIGLSTNGRQVFEEGLCLPVTKLVEAGRPNQWLFDLIAVNVREPVQVLGDIHSEIASNAVGGQRLVAMMDEFSLDSLDGLAAHILAHSRSASLAAIRALPFGTWRYHMRVDGLEAPIDLHAALTIGPEGIDVDFAGTSGPSGFGINVPLCYTEAYTSFGVKCIVAPEVPNNTASLATIRVTAPPDSILNAQRPAPVAGRGTIGQMLPDVVFGCLRQAIPDRVPAEGTSCLWNIRLMGGPGRVAADPAVLARATAFNVTGFHSGGTGARPRQDGLSATAFPSGVRNVPVEVTESLAPVLIWRKEFRPDSGGAGTWRGGLGQIMEIESAEAAPFAIGTAFDRVVHPARGAEGGAPGATGSVRLRSGKVFPGKGQHTVPAGDRLIVEMPGGGGMGDPRRRDPALLARDVRHGFVSSEAAARDYAATPVPKASAST